MKKLISLLACAALLVGLVIAVFPAVTGTADTAITTPGFTGEAPGTTTFKLGGANGETTSEGNTQATLTVGADKTYTYNLKQNLGYWVKNQVYAPDNKTAADVREFKFLYVNVTDLQAGYCTNAQGQFVDDKGSVVNSQDKAKHQAGFYAKLVPQVKNSTDIKRKTADGSFESWNIIDNAGIRSRGYVQIDLEALKKQMEAQNAALSASEQEYAINVDEVLSNLTFNTLVYGSKLTVELYVSNNEEFNPTPVNPTSNPTVSLEMSASSDKGTVTKNADGYFDVKPASDKIALLNVFTASGAGNIDASAYPYLHSKIVVSNGAKVTSAVLIDKDGNEYKKDGTAVNIFGGSVERTKQVVFETKGMTDADKAQFLSNLRIKLTIEGGSVSILSKLSTKEDLKIGSENVPGVTAHKLTARPGAGMPGNSDVFTDEETGTTKFQLGGHLAAWVPAALYNGNKEVDATQYQYLIVDVKSMTDGRCMDDSNTHWAKQDDKNNWITVDSEEEAKLQTGFMAAVQLSYKNKKGENVQLKKVNLDANGDVKLKDGKVDGGDWNVLGEARQPMTMAPVDFNKLAEQVAENNAALDKALEAKKISQSEYDTERSA